jgi:ferric-dicitrate binding protein FerR (iron transport regulator)
MFAQHVSNLTSAYCHDELSPEQSRRVAEHLISCRRCRGDFEEIKFGARLAAQLPLLVAADSLWAEIESALDREGRTPLTRPRPFLIQPRLVLVSLALVALVIGFAALWLRHNPKSVGLSWDVARLDGAPRIGSALVGDKAKLGVGQWLETDTNSRAQIRVGDLGLVQIDPNTRVRLVETKPTEHRLELAEGRLSARISAPPKLFFVDTPSGVAEDLGCAYTLEVDKAGNSLLRVTTGWVALQLKDRESVVPAGAACATKPGIGPGTPYFEDASETFRSALTRVDFDHDSIIRGNVTPLEIVLSSARVRDSLTLWNLLSRVSSGEREQVYDRLAALAPPPQSVTREGILKLNQQMLDAWKEQLESRWGDALSSGPFQGWVKIWSCGLGKLNGLGGKK